MIPYFVVGEIYNNKGYYEIYDIALGEKSTDETGTYVTIATGEFTGTIAEYVNENNIFGVIEIDPNILIKVTNSKNLNDWQNFYKTKQSGRILHYIEDEKKCQVESLDKQSWMELLESSFYDQKDLFLFRVFKDGVYNARKLNNNDRK